jgi:hypothetical protein
MLFARRAGLRPVFALRTFPLLLRPLLVAGIRPDIVALVAAKASSSFGVKPGASKMCSLPGMFLLRSPGVKTSLPASSSSMIF